MKRTLVIIHSDALEKYPIEDILAMIKENGFAIKAIKTLSLPRIKAEEFYSNYKEKVELFNALVESITSGPIYVIVLEKENAIEEFQRLISRYTDMKIFGSYSDEGAKEETLFFFSDSEIA